jgi:hypothetical protein
MLVRSKVLLNTLTDPGAADCFAFGFGDQRVAHRFCFCRLVKPVLWRGTTLFPVRPYIEIGQWQFIAWRLARAEILLSVTMQAAMWRR